MTSRPRIRRHALHALALAAGLLLAAASLAATGYVLYLKDGGRIDAKEVIHHRLGAGKARRWW